MTNNLKDLRHNEILSRRHSFSSSGGQREVLFLDTFVFFLLLLSPSLYRRGERVKVRSVVGHWDEMQNSVMY